MADSPKITKNKLNINNYQLKINFWYFLRRNKKIFLELSVNTELFPPIIR